MFLKSYDVFNLKYDGNIFITLQGHGQGFIQLK